jgi:uncharacterized membrane protein
MLLLAAVSLALFAAGLVQPALSGEVASRTAELLGKTCHRLPGRSLQLPWGTSGLCARCTAFWAAAGFVSLAMALGVRPPGLSAGLLLLAPLVVDGGLQYLGLYESNNPLRVITGLAAGAGVAFLYCGLARRLPPLRRG